jgi:hypothetical protein
MGGAADGITSGLDKPRQQYQSSRYGEKSI